MMDNLEEIFRIIEEINTDSENERKYENKIFSYGNIKFSLKNILLYTEKKNEIVLTDDDTILLNSNCNINIERSEYNPYKINLSNEKIIEFLNKTPTRNLDIYFNYLKEKNYNLNNLLITENNIKYIIDWKIDDYENIFKADFDISNYFKKIKINAFSTENLNSMIYKVNKNLSVNLSEIKKYLHNFCSTCQLFLREKYKFTYEELKNSKCYLNTCYKIKINKKIEDSYTDIVLHNRITLRTVIQQNDFIEQLNLIELEKNLVIKNEKHLFLLSTILTTYYNKIDYAYTCEFILRFIENKYLTKNIFKILLITILNILKSEYLQESILFKINKIIYTIHEKLEELFISMHIDLLEQIYKKFLFVGSQFSMKIKIKNIKN